MGFLFRLLQKKGSGHISGLVKASNLIPIKAAAKQQLDALQLRHNLQTTTATTKEAVNPKASIPAPVRMCVDLPTAQINVNDLTLVSCSHCSRVYSFARAQPPELAKKLPGHGSSPPPSFAALMAKEQEQQQARAQAHDSHEQPIADAIQKWENGETDVIAWEENGELKYAHGKAAEEKVRAIMTVRQSLAAIENDAQEQLNCCIVVASCCHWLLLFCAVYDNQFIT